MSTPTPTRPPGSLLDRRRSGQPAPATPAPEWTGDGPVPAWHSVTWATVVAGWGDELKGRHARLVDVWVATGWNRAAAGILAYAQITKEGLGHAGPKDDAPTPTETTP